MPPAPAPAKKPGLDLKRLPKWAWVLAIAGGAVVGYFVLKKAPGGDSGAGASTADQPSQPDSAGSPVVAAPLDEMLKALGLSPNFVSQSYSGGDGGGGDGGDDGGAAPSSSLIYPNDSGYYNLSSIAGASALTPAQSTYQGSLATPYTPAYTPSQLISSGVITRSGAGSSGSSSSGPTQSSPGVTSGGAKYF